MPENNYYLSSSSQIIKTKDEQMIQLGIQKKKETRKEQKCVFCRNHNLEISKKGHKNECKFNNENHIKSCPDCSQTRKRQESTAVEKKNNYQIQKNHLILNPIDDHHLGSQYGKRTRALQKCKKCLNHGLYKTMRNHLKECANKFCKCLKCRETDGRRSACKEEAKSRRDKNRTKFHQSDSPRSVDSDFTMSSPQSDCSNFEEKYTPSINSYDNFYQNKYERAISPDEFDLFEHGDYYSHQIKPHFLCSYSSAYMQHVQGSLGAIPSTVKDFEPQRNYTCIELFDQTVSEDLLEQFSKNYDETPLSDLKEDLHFFELI